MREVFVDSSAWYPLAVASHPDHAPLARSLRDAVHDGCTVVTTNLIVAETYALLLRRAGREAAMRFLGEVRSGPIVVVDSTEELERAAADDWLATYDDQPFSLCDAVSFTVMRDRGITEALALDHHFEVAGFLRAP